MTNWSEINGKLVNLDSLTSIGIYPGSKVNDEPKYVIRFMFCDTEVASIGSEDFDFVYDIYKFYKYKLALNEVTRKADDYERFN